MAPILSMRTIQCGLQVETYMGSLEMELLGLTERIKQDMVFLIWMSIGGECTIVFPCIH